jgi:hypothetical protein
MHETPEATCNWPRQQCHLWNSRGSIVSGLVRERKVLEWSAKVGCRNVLTGDVAARDKISGFNIFTVCQDSYVTCGKFAEASSADWSAKEGCGNILTADSSIRCTKLLKRLAIGQDSNVTFGRFAEASSADWSAKERCSNVPRRALNKNASEMKTSKNARTHPQAS